MASRWCPLSAKQAQGRSSKSHHNVKLTLQRKRIIVDEHSGRILVDKELADEELDRMNAFLDGSLQKLKSNFTEAHQKSLPFGGLF